MSVRFGMVQLDNLLTSYHHGTQRHEGTSSRRVAEMVADWDLGKVGTVSVSERGDGSQFVMDGAHRVHAAREVGLTELPAMIHAGLTREQEAALFGGLNTFGRPSAVSRFLARVAAGEDEATEIKSIIESHGWRIAQAQKPGVFAAIEAAERAYRSGAGVLPAGRHPDTLDWVLSILTAAWDHDADSVNLNIVQGLAQMYGRFGSDIDAKKLTSALAQTRPKILIGKARGSKDARGGTVPAHLAAVLVGLHNHGKRTRLLPEWVWTR